MNQNLYDYSLRMESKPASGAAILLTLCLVATLPICFGIARGANPLLLAFTSFEHVMIFGLAYWYGFVRGQHSRNSATP